MKAKELVRMTGISPAMPGNEMLTRAIVICKRMIDNLKNEVLE